MPIQAKLVTEALRRWTRTTEADHSLTLKEAQELIAPYLVTKYQDAGEVTLFIANREGAAWYDQIELSDLAYCRALGLIRRGDTVFDCGANQGLTGIVSSLCVGPDGRVMCFEPFPRNAELIRINCLLNGITNIQVVEQGVADYVGEVIASITSQSIHSASSDAVDTLKVSITRLDEYANLKPNFIKIDIEGAELLCLRGATKVLSHVPAICLEYHPDMIDQFGVSTDELFHIISAEKYRIYVRYEGSSVVELYRFQHLGRRCWLYFVPTDRSEITRTRMTELDLKSAC